MGVLVILPKDAPALTPGGEGLTIVRYSTAAEVVAALETADGATVLASDGLAPGDEPTVAAAILRRGVRVIEVRAERWDGRSHSALSAACRGVISGFGVAAGVKVAVAVSSAG